MDEIIKKIQYFAELFNQNELIFLSEYYKKRLKKYNEKKPVNMLRYNLLQYLSKNKKLTSHIIEIKKQKIRKIFHKNGKNYNPFHSWKNDRILYSFCYYPYNDKILKYLEEFTKNLRIKLNIKNKTKFNIVTFNGAQNQGFNHCWIAIYDNKFISQQETKQMYIGFRKDGVTFDIYEYQTQTWGTNLKEPKGKISYEQFTIEKIKRFFENKKEDIFELHHLEEQLNKSKKKFEKNEKFTIRERKSIKRKIYSEESIFNSPTQVRKRINHHYQIYNLISEFMKNNFDSYNYEENNVDIIAIKKDNIYLFEIKPYDNPIYTIRFALGQLLEYYYKCKESVKYLCFVGITPLGESKIYFNYLKNILKNERFELKYFYVNYDNGKLIEDK